jgi:hypothetical protein
MDEGSILTIAGIQFNIRAKHITLPESKDLQKPYHPFFLNLPPQSFMQKVTVDITDAAAPALSGSEKIFDVCGVWQVYRHAGETYIVNEIPSFPRPLWVARIHEHEDKVTIYCAGQTLRGDHKAVMMHPLCYPLDQILMMQVLAEHEGAIFHAAGWSGGASGWVFPGKSGAGKTTISRIINAASGIMPLSDDRVVVRKIEKEYHFFGTPWPGEAGYAGNRSAGLSGILFLEKGPENSIRKLNPSDAVARLFPVMSVPWYDAKRVDRIMTFCDDLIKTIPAYRFTFTPDEQAIHALNRFINEQ